VVITIKEDHDALYATITDDGCGFNVGTLLKAPDQDRGLGLAGMSERALLLGGTLNIHSSPGQGTTIEVHLALNANEEHTAKLPSDLSGEKAQ